jgi:hypothetical protein
MKTCLICKRTIKDSKILGCLDSAGYIYIDFGYGSKHDMENHRGFIHDHCFESIQEFVE